MKNHNVDLKARIRNRRWQRGVAMVEGAIIFPGMAIFLVVMELAHNMYDLKLETLHRARERAWSYSLEGCTGERDDDSYKRSYFTIDGSQTKDSGTTVGSATKHSATVIGTGTASRGGRSYSKKAATTTTVYCNPTLGPKLKLQTVIDKIF